MIDTSNSILASPPAPLARRPDGLAARQGDFASVIARANGQSGETTEETAREGAQQFVAITLVQPLLKQLRETNGAAAPFAPSSAELQFRSMMDAQLAQRIVRASGFGIVDAIARSLTHAGAGEEKA
jgi:Rod binding domain-containing protein